MAASASTLTGLADTRSKVLDFIYWTARGKGRSSRFLHGTGRVNQAAVCRAMGIDPAQLTRLIDGDQEVGMKFISGLMAFSGLKRGDLWDEVENAPQAPRGAFGPKYP